MALFCFLHPYIDAYVCLPHQRNSFETPNKNTWATDYMDITAEKLKANVKDSKITDKWILFLPGFRKMKQERGE